MDNIPGLYSQEETPNKQEDFRKIIRHHLNVCANIREKHSWANKYPYLYIDAYGGPGRYCGIVGSPLIFLEEAQAAGIPFRAIAIEIDPERAQALREAANGNLTVYQGHNCDYIKRIPMNHNQFGLLYCDPPGAKDEAIPLSFQIMSEVAKRARRLDVMINMAPASHKRTIELAGYTSIADLKKSVTKQEWAIRSTRGKHQWTFLIGTNWIEWAKWNRAGFYSLNSEMGELLFDKVNLTGEQFKKKVQPHLTGLMQSTCDTPNLELSERRPSGGPVAFVSGVIGGLLRKYII